MNNFTKAHGLGNSYIVLDSENINFDLKKEFIIKICNRDYGIGSDGVLLKVASENADFGLRIFNPDGSEAEKSGNGLRIFGKFLYDANFTREKSFSIDTKGGRANIEVLEENDGKASLLKAYMGVANFKPENIPVDMDLDEVLDTPIYVGDQVFRINCVSTGNPHCVILTEHLDPNYVKKYGPIIEKHAYFPAKTNVQFVKISSRDELDILIWERGAGYTQASGSSSCAAAAVARKYARINSKVSVNMPGGKLIVEIDKDWNLFLTGPVEKVCEGVLNDDFVRI